MTQLLFRFLGSNFFLIYLGQRIFQQILFTLRHPSSQSMLGWINWGLIMLTFVLLASSYVVRGSVVSKASRLREIVFPIFCILLPIGVYDSALGLKSSWVLEHPAIMGILKSFYRLQDAWVLSPALFILIGNVLTVAGMYSLKGSFSIFTEARAPIYQGPYRWIRHPVYVGESIATIGFCLLHISWLNIFLTVVLLVGQRVRAYFEEVKLEGVFPEYRIYKKKTGAYFPRVDR